MKANCGPWVRFAPWILPAWRVEIRLPTSTPMRLSVIRGVGQVNWFANGRCSTKVTATFSAEGRWIARRALIVLCLSNFRVSRSVA